jgi:ectoine hydroxylase-related dioxygenase (phytanoyl-CoA dioxygenase family)
VSANTPGPLDEAQVAAYWRIEGTDVCSLWMPVDPVAKNSAFEFVSGPHCWDSVFRRESVFAEGFGSHSSDAERAARSGNETARAAAPDIEARRENFSILSWDVEPGDCLAFTGMVFHGARGNHAKVRPLRALAARWAGDDARFAVKPEGSDPDLRGRGLEHGDPFGGDPFPVAWPRAART